MGTIVVLDILGGAALLLWGLHMVQTGIIRAFGPHLRRFLSHALSNRFSALAAGLGLTAVLQSSTATGLMTAAFAAEGLVSLVPALAIMLGANVGTTLIVQVLSFNIAAAAPVLFVLGLVSFRSGAGPLKDLGRVSIGLGLMLLALHILIDSLAPAENAPAMRAVLRAITGDPVLCIAIATALTWALHSSVATVLLVMSLAFSNFITPAAALALVVGANLGSAINPVIEGTRRDDRASYRLPLGNLLNRIVGAALVTPFLPAIASHMQGWQPDAAKMTAEFHIAFNIVLALLFLPLLDPVAALLTRLMPASPAANDESKPRYLDESALATPSLALADAARETLRMGDVVETMLRKVMDALMTGDRALIGEVSRLDNVVDRLDEAIKLYVTRLTRGSLDERESHRAMEIISFSINLEHIGDIIDKNLNELAAKKAKRGLRFSADGAAELGSLHRQVLDGLRASFGVFMRGNVEQAHRLLADKAQLQDAERLAAEHHLNRLREGRPETVETTSVHLDVLRDLRRIHAHICAVAYPVLETAGELPAPARDNGAAAANPRLQPGG